jgi:hypothetical protein
MMCLAHGPRHHYLSHTHCWSSLPIDFLSGQPAVNCTPVEELFWHWNWQLGFGVLMVVFTLPSCQGTGEIGCLVRSSIHELGRMQTVHSRNASLRILDRFLFLFPMDHL